MEKDASVTPANRKLIVGFTENRLAQGTSGFRIVKVIYCLRYMAKWLGKGFDEASKQDLIALVGEIERRPYAEWSKYDFKVVLKLFFRWLKGNDEENPPETKWLRPKLKNTAKKLPEELLTEAEVYRMAQAAHHPRDKALVLVLYESGCRIGEMLSLKIKNVQFDQYGAVLRVTGKTGDRRVRIIQSASELGKWLEIHPNKETESWLWPPRSNNAYRKESPAECQSIYVMLKKLAKSAGITKKVYPHLFRHSRATFLASKLTEAQMKEYFGWTQCSDMAATYVHLSGRDVDQSLLKLYHMEDKNDES
ncbi:MAG: tyrosine-type recombinase/integrase, partial [Candidatus Micrarchaeota archaeon]|nr:tyrosine-type recombinase/integrase [Candidatus Micrarchaeota archaeon]